MTENAYPDFPGIEPYGTIRSLEDERAHRKAIVARGYQIFAALRWGMLGDGHVTARDPEHTDSFWMLNYGFSFAEATPERLVLVAPDGTITDGEGNETGAVNTAGRNIHTPLYQARPDVVGACHTHTQYGTPWSAMVEPFRALSQESCAFVFDQSVWDDGEVEVLSVEGGARIAAALGQNKLVMLRNHGMLTVGRTVESAIASFVSAERVAEVHIKAPNGKAISDEAAKVAAETMQPDLAAWRTYHWIDRSIG